MSRVPVSFATLIIFCLYLTPSLPTPDPLPAIRIEEILLAGWGTYVILICATGRTYKLVWGPRQSLLVGFVVFILASILSGLMTGYPGSLGDLFQLVRIGKFLLVYTVVASAISGDQFPSVAREAVLKAIGIAGTLLALIAFQQYFDIFGWNDLYISFVTRNQADRLLDLAFSRRVVGMVGNPNEAGFLLAASGIVSVHLAILKGYIPYIATFMIQLAGVLLTISRSALVVVVVGVVYLLLVQTGDRPGWRKVLSIRRIVVATWLVVLAVAILGYFLHYFDFISTRLIGLLDPTGTSSLRIRLEGWRRNWHLFLESPVLGIGPLRRTEFIDFIADNEWLLMLRSYGIVGTLYFIGIFVVPGRKKVLERQTLRQQRWGPLARAIVIGMFLYMIPAAVYHHNVLMPVVLVVLAASDISDCEPRGCTTAIVA